MKKRILAYLALIMIITAMIPAVEIYAEDVPLTPELLDFAARLALSDVSAGIYEDIKGQHPGLNDHLLQEYVNDRIDFDIAKIKQGIAADWSKYPAQMKQNISNAFTQAYQDYQQISSDYNDWLKTPFKLITDTGVAIADFWTNILGVNKLKESAERGGGMTRGGGAERRPGEPGQPPLNPAGDPYTLGVWQPIAYSSFVNNQVILNFFQQSNFTFSSTDINKYQGIIMPNGYFYILMAYFRRSNNNIGQRIIIAKEDQPVKYDFYGTFLCGMPTSTNTPINLVRAPYFIVPVQDYDFKTSSGANLGKLLEGNRQYFAVAPGLVDLKQSASIENIVTYFVYLDQEKPPTVIHDIDIYNIVNRNTVNNNTINPLEVYENYDEYNEFNTYNFYTYNPTDIVNFYLPSNIFVTIPTTPDPPTPPGGGDGPGTWPLWPSPPPYNPPAYVPPPVLSPAAPNTDSEGGFWSNLWHNILKPFEFVGDLFKWLADRIGDIFDWLLERLKNLLLWLFIPSDEFWETQNDNLTSVLKNKLPADEFIDVIRSLENIRGSHTDEYHTDDHMHAGITLMNTNSGTMSTTSEMSAIVSGGGDFIDITSDSGFDDIAFTMMEVDVVLPISDIVNRYIPVLRGLIRGFFYIILAYYSYRNIIFFIRKTHFMPLGLTGSMDTIGFKPD